MSKINHIIISAVYPRMPHIPQVVRWAQTSNIITSACFSPNGQMALAGLYDGLVVLYQSDTLKYFTQIDCKNRAGKHKRGKKVTGLQFTDDGKYLLVTTNDSRIRLYDMSDYSMAAKYKGHRNDGLQIQARFSKDCKYVICGSQSENLYVWNTSNDYVPAFNPDLLPSRTRVKSNSYEYFSATTSTVTCALFLPQEAIEIAFPHCKAKIKHCIATTTWEGDLKFFENRGEPKLL